MKQVRTYMYVNSGHSCTHEAVSLIIFSIRCGPWDSWGQSRTNYQPTIHYSLDRGSSTRCSRKTHPLLTLANAHPTGKVLQSFFLLSDAFFHTCMPLSQWLMNRSKKFYDENIVCALDFSCVVVYWEGRLPFPVHLAVARLSSPNHSPSSPTLTSLFT